MRATDRSKKYKGRRKGLKHSAIAKMVLSFPERAFLLKLFYQNENNVAEALSLYQRQKSLRTDPVTPCALQRMVKHFEETGSFSVEAGRG